MTGLTLMDPTVLFQLALALEGSLEEDMLWIAVLGLFLVTLSGDAPYSKQRTFTAK
jgi:hypothetical protein